MILQQDKLNSRCCNPKNDLHFLKGVNDAEISKIGRKDLQTMKQLFVIVDAYAVGNGAMYAAWPCLQHVVDVLLNLCITSAIFNSSKKGTR